MIGELLHYIPLFRIQQGDTGGIDMKTITNARNFYQEYFPHAKYNELGYSVLNFTYSQIVTGCSNDIQFPNEKPPKIQHVKPVSPLFQFKNQLPWPDTP